MLSDLHGKGARADEADVRGSTTRQPIGLSSPQSAALQATCLWCQDHGEPKRATISLPFKQDWKVPIARHGMLVG